MDENSACPRLFQNTFRIKSARMLDWDYSAEGFYFVTICTKNRQPWFGEICDGEMCLTRIGEIVRQCWEDIPRHYDRVDINCAFCIMPDHIHGIIAIDAPPVVETPHAASLRQQTKTANNASPSNNYRHSEWKPASLGSIINQFKSACSKNIHNAGFSDFAWQSRFYDRIIRNEKELRRVRQYIMDNPLHVETPHAASLQLFTPASHNHAPITAR